METPPEQVSRGPRPPSLVVAFSLVLAALAVVAGARVVGVGSGERSVSPPRDRASVVRRDAEERAKAERAAQVARLLARRARAVLTRDRAEFLATVDPTQRAFRVRQAAYFDALREVPLAAWRYELTNDERTVPTALRAPGARPWATEIVLHYRLRDFDDELTRSVQHATFVHRAGGWLLAADDDGAAVGARTTRELWDFGPVRVVRGRYSLVLGHPARASLLRTIAAEVDAAVPRVSRVWRAPWSQRVVVVVPTTQAELARILDDDSDLSQIAAVSVAELGESSAGYRPVGNRILVNPPNFDRLRRLGRRVVVTHEVTHVATRTATGPNVPTWLVEGFADYVGYLGTDITVRQAATELAADVRAGRLPTRLPNDADFAGSNRELPETYEQSWLACRMIVAQTSQDALVRFYRHVGASRHPAPDALRTAFRAVLHTTPQSFLRAWRAYLRNELG